MTTCKTTILFILTYISILTTNAESKLARINDVEGFSNVRSGQSSNSVIVAKLEKSDFFYCDETKSDWLKIVALKWKDGNQIEGFLHKSRVQFIEDLDISIRKQLLTTILSEQQALATTFQRIFSSRDKSGYKAAVSALENHAEIKYTPILEILPQYFSKTNDLEVLQLFISTMWADKGSANEIPSLTIGQCYILKPSVVLSQVKPLKNADQRNLIYDQMEWGLKNYFEADADGKSNNKEYLGLKKQLDSARKKASP